MSVFGLVSQLEKKRKQSRAERKTKIANCFKQLSYSHSHIPIRMCMSVTFLVRARDLVVMLRSLWRANVPMKTERTEQKTRNSCTCCVGNNIQKHVPKCVRFTYAVVRIASAAVNLFLSS